MALVERFWSRGVARPHIVHHALGGTLSWAVACVRGTFTGGGWCMAIGAEAAGRELSQGTPALPSMRAPSSARVAARYGLGDAAAVGSRASLKLYRRLALASDAFCASAAAALALWLRFGSEPSLVYVVISMIAPVVWIVVVASQRGYENRFLGSGPDEYRRLADATLILFAMAAVVSFALKGDLSRGVLAVFLPEAFLFSLLGRRRLRSWIFQRRLAGHGLQRVLVVGRADSVSQLVEQLDREPWHGLHAVGACVAGNEARGLEGETALNMPVATAADDTTIVQQVDALGADVVAVASHPDLSGHALRRLAWALDERKVDLIVSPGIVEVAGPRLSIRPVAGLSLLFVQRPSTRGGRMLAKGALDRLFGILLFLAVAPVTVVAALAVKCWSPGPVLFRQVRIGVDGRPFEMLRIRSVVVDAETGLVEVETASDGNGVLFKIRKDPRMSRVGSILRRFSVDGLPQLWNVVRGDMSLVGPRPPLPQEVASYSSDASRRLRVRPGITGLWQVRGRSDLSWEESLRLDLRYVDNWSFTLDATILWRTWRAVMSRRRPAERAW